MISEKEIQEIELRVDQSQNGPWKAYIQGRDHDSNSSFIMTGSKEKPRVNICLAGATIADIDFIANAKQDIPRLIKEIKELQSQIQKDIN
jgi:hypothetical protein